MFARRVFPAIVLTLFFLMDFGKGLAETANKEVVRKNEDSLFSIIEDRMEIKIEEYVNSFTRYLEDYNDKHLGQSMIGRLLHYKEIKPKLEQENARGRMKKMAMTMMPLIFHVGATSTWMVLTTILAAKSVMIGMTLLIFKIAVSSAKLAAFFTQWKSHHHHDDHHGWSWSPPSHHEYHGHDRSFSDVVAPTHDIEHHTSSHEYHHPSPTHHTEHHSDSSPPSDWHSYNPEWTPGSSEYHTIPASYKHADIPLTSDKHEEYPGPYLHPEEHKADKKRDNLLNTHLV